MKDLLLDVHGVVKTTNLEIWRCRLADYVKECYSIKVRAARAALLFFLIQPIKSLFSGAVFAVAFVLSLK